MPHLAPMFRNAGAALIGAALAIVCTGADERAAAAAPTTVRLHVGVPDRVFIGQPRDLLLKAFPGAESSPFAGQKDAITVRSKDGGISCVLTGTSDEDFRVASVGFNLEGIYEGIGEGEWRTEADIGKGSTVNDLLAAYGQPADIIDKGARRRPGSRPAPDTPKLYQYRNDDGTVSTSFVVQSNRVVRIVVNHLEPLERHLLRRSPTEPAPVPGGSAPVPEAPPSPASPPGSSPPQSPSDRGAPPS